MIYFILGLLLLMGCIIADVPSMIMLLGVYLFGCIVLRVFVKHVQFKQLFRLFSSLMIAGSIYMLLCYAYMKAHNYRYLLAWDTINAFIPRTQYYMQEGNFLSALDILWSGYTFFDRNQCGYFTTSILFGFTSKFFNADFYLALQMNTLLFYSLTGVVLYSIFCKCSLDSAKAYKYTCFIMLFSVIFFYSSQILRDIHVLFLYLLAMLPTFNKEFSFVTLMKIILVCLVCCTFRIESGLFLFINIPVYLLLTIKRSRSKWVVGAFSAIIFIPIVVLLANNMELLKMVYNNYNMSYIEGVDEGDGIIAALQRVPVAGDILSIFYNGFQPVPFWSKWHGVTKLECYNIMRFPQLWNAFFNMMVIIGMFFFLFDKRLRQQVHLNMNTALRANIWVGMVYLYLQSSVISQRRLMGYYSIFYIFFFIILNKMPTTTKKSFWFVSIFSFIALQVTGVLLLS